MGPMTILPEPGIESALHARIVGAPGRCKWPGRRIWPEAAYQKSGSCKSEGSVSSGRLVPGRYGGSSPESGYSRKLARCPHPGLERRFSLLLVSANKVSISLCLHGVESGDRGEKYMWPHYPEEWEVGGLYRTISALESRGSLLSHCKKSYPYRTNQRQEGMTCLNALPVKPYLHG